MLLDEQANKYRALDEWFQLPQGRRVAYAFSMELTQVSDQLNGNKLLQLGSCGENPWLSTLKFRHKHLVSPCAVTHKSLIISSLTTLPIERDSIDCVIAPLTLEAFSAGKNPLSEIDRVLKPMGYAIFFGINPWSFWGAALRMKRLACFGPGGDSTLTSSLAVRRMMLQRGYRQCALTSFYYIPPVTSEFLIQKLAFFNEMGKMVWPFPAAFYCFIAQKYQHCHPSLLAEVVNTGLVEPKSTLQAAGKWIHDELI